MFEQSVELTNFYNEYYAWIKEGAPDTHPIFYNGRGLCGNLYYYIKAHPSAAGMIGLDEMEAQFLAAGLSKSYPFGEREYNRASKNNTHHLDPNRIRWVESHLTRKVNIHFSLI